MLELLAAVLTGQHVPTYSEIGGSVVLGKAFENVLSTNLATTPPLGVLLATRYLTVLIVRSLLTSVTATNAARTVTGRIFFESHLCHGALPLLAAQAGLEPAYLPLTAGSTTDCGTGQCRR